MHIIMSHLSYCYLLSLLDVDGCTVCKDAFKVPDRLRRLPCNHLFHESCIIPWLKLVSNTHTHSLPEVEMHATVVLGVG